MDMVGGLVYVGNTGSTYNLDYITASAEIFSTDILELLEGLFGEVPSLLEALQGALQDALEGILTGAIAAVPIEEIMSHIPLTIEANTPITLKSYLQGGNDQYWYAPADIEFKGASCNSSGYAIVLPSLVDLSIFAVRVVHCRYGTILASDRVKPAWPEGSFLVTPLAGGEVLAYSPNGDTIGEYRQWQTGGILYSWRRT